jgi:hypothetical protein
MRLRVEVTDAALFLYPEFVQKANALETPGKGISLTPPSGRPGSTVENIVMSRSTAQKVVEAIDCALATLDEECKAIVAIKFGWRWENDRLVVAEPVGTKQTFDVLCKMDMFHWCERYYYERLEELRKRVGDYLESLGSALFAAFGMMPKRRRKIRKITDEEFKEVKKYLEDRKVKFAVKPDENPLDKSAVDVG